MVTTTRSRSNGSAKRSPRAKPDSTPVSRAASLRGDTQAAMRRLRTRTTRAMKSVPLNRTTVSIGVAALATVTLAGIAAFMGRERLSKAAATSREKIKHAADEISMVAHEKIDQARSNITKLRTRNTGTAPETDMAVAI